jgi:hypothetical protein
MIIATIGQLKLNALNMRFHFGVGFVQPSQLLVGLAQRDGSSLKRVLEFRNFSILLRQLNALSGNNILLLQILLFNTLTLGTPLLLHAAKLRSVLFLSQFELHLHALIELCAYVAQLFNKFGILQSQR